SNEALQLLDLGRARTLEEGLGLEGDPPQKKAANPQQVAARLKAVILFYALGTEKSWLWAVTPHNITLFTLPKQSDIESLAQSYQRSILKSSDPLRDSNQAAQLLYDALVAPAASMIPKDSRIFLIPDGALNGLNFE